MPVKVVFECGGCAARVETFANAKFVGFTGRSHGFGTVVEDKISNIAPKGWVAFDPYTYCCYCPECWSGIVAAIEEGPADA